MDHRDTEKEPEKEPGPAGAFVYSVHDSRAPLDIQLPTRRRFNTSRLRLAALLLLVAFATAFFVRRAANHPKPDAVLAVAGADAAATRIDLPREGRLVVALQLESSLSDSYSVMVYRVGANQPVFKAQDLDPLDGRLSLILPLDKVVPADYMVRVLDDQGDDEDGVYRFTTVAPR